MDAHSTVISLKLRLSKKKWNDGEENARHIVRAPLQEDKYERNEWPKFIMDRNKYTIEPNKKLPRQKTIEGKKIQVIFSRRSTARFSLSQLLAQIKNNHNLSHCEYKYNHKMQQLKIPIKIRMKKSNKTAKERKCRP